jgi:hypothetical protein
MRPQKDMKEEFKKYDMERKLKNYIFPFLKNIWRVRQIIYPPSKKPSQLSPAKRGRRLHFSWWVSLPSPQPSSVFYTTKYITTSRVVTE